MVKSEPVWAIVLSETAPPVVYLLSEV
jgi:hypothetical protein